MLIDFAKIKGLIPEKGNLKLVFSASGQDKIRVLIASQHDAKGTEKPELRPLLVEGTVEELSREFDEAISDLGTAEKMLVAASTISRSPKAAVEARKKEISEAVNKTKPAPAAAPGSSAKTEAQPKGNTKSEPQTPKKETLNSLFAAAVVDEKPAGEGAGTPPPNGSSQETEAGQAEAISDAAGKEQEAA